MSSSNPSMRFKIAFKLAIQRLRMLSSKKEAMNKKERRNIAMLLEKGKVETARVRVETIINEEIYIELLEVVELYCELCSARFDLIEQSREVDPGIQEAVAGIIHASPKTDIKELHTLSSLFQAHYGREFYTKCTSNEDSIVPQRITHKLIIQTPSQELVDLYLFEIAKAYSVDWKPDALSSTTGEDSAEATLDEESAQEREALASLPSKIAPEPKDASRTVLIHDLTPPHPSTGLKPAAGPDTSTKETGTDAEEDEFLAMQKRFAALKRK